MPDNAGDDYYRAVIERVARDVDDLRRDIRNPQPPYVLQEVFEAHRRYQGERIGELERSVVSLQADLRVSERDNESRYRTTVNFALGAFLSFLGGIGLLILQLVTR